MITVKNIWTENVADTAITDLRLIKHGCRPGHQVLVQRGAKQINVKSICMEFTFTKFNEGIKFVVSLTVVLQWQEKLLSC